MKQTLIVVSAITLLAWGCASHDSGSVKLSEPTIESRTITAAELPAEFDTSRTYQYGSPSLHDPQAVLVALLDAGFIVTRAWQPLDDRCENMLGPRFTVELAAADAKLEDHGFKPGVGLLYCATALTEYTVSWGGS